MKKRSEDCKKWRESHPEYFKTPEFKRKKLDSGLRYKYNGFTLEDKENLWIKQNGICPICLKPLPEYDHPKCAVDHNHTTGKVRGLLHINCNVWVGFVDIRGSWVLDTTKDYLYNK